jgi:hypothetical protein
MTLAEKRGLLTPEAARRAAIDEKYLAVIGVVVSGGDLQH